MWYFHKKKKKNKKLLKEIYKWLPKWLPRQRLSLKNLYCLFVSLYISEIIEKKLIYIPSHVNKFLLFHNSFSFLTKMELWKVSRFTFLFIATD